MDTPHPTPRQVGDPPGTLSFAGFMLQNNMLLIVGSLIGSSGAILTWIMCKAMNRSIISVIFGGLGTAKGPQMAIEGEATVVDLDDVVQELISAKKVIIVPGYGLAVAQGQYPVAEMVARLRAHKVAFPAPFPSPSGWP